MIFQAIVKPCKFVLFLKDNCNDCNAPNHIGVLSSVVISLSSPEVFAVTCVVWNRCLENVLLDMLLSKISKLGKWLWKFDFSWSEIFL